MRKVSSLFALFLLFFLPLHQALAQVDLVVSVLDNGTRKPVAGLPVHLDNAAVGFSAEQTTDGQGKVRFRGLSTAGTYAVSTTATERFQAVREANLTLRANSNPSVTLVLPLAATQNLDEVTVRAPNNATTINTQNAEVASGLSARELREIPIEARDITRSLYRLPNVTLATGFFSEAPNVSINGANGLYTNYLIDGLDNNENFLGGQRFAIPVGFAQNVSVLTNNFSTEFGNSANGIVNVTTKSGSNDLTAEVYYLTRPGPSIDGKTDFAQRDLSGNQVKSGFQRQQFGFGVGGALVKDQTFFYLNAEQTFDFKDNVLTSPDLGVAATVRGQNRFTLLSGKLDQRWTERFRSSLRANVGIVNIERQGGGLDGGVAFPSTGNRQDRNSLNLASQNVYVSNRFTSETNVQYARFRWNYARADNPNSPDVTMLASGRPVAVLGHPGYLFDSRQSTWQAQQKFTLLRGSHTFKGGFGIISTEHSLFGGGNPNGSYSVTLTPAQLDALRARNLGAGLSINDIPADVQVNNYSVELRPQSFGTTQNLYHVYLEDLYAVTDRLNVTLGLRYDYDNLSKGGAVQGDRNNVAPRANFNFQLTDRSSLRGGYGLFYDKILYTVYSDALQQNTTSADYKIQLRELVRVGALPASTNVDRVTFEGNLSGSAAGVAYLQGPSAASLQSQRAGVPSGERRILNPSGYQNPYAHQSTLGYQYQVSRKTLFYVDVMYNRSYDLFRLRNVNAVSEYPVTDPNNVTVRTPTQADATRPVPIRADGSAVIGGQTVTGVARNVVVTESEGRSRYMAASFNLQKDAADDKYGYRVAYTLSNLKNDTEDVNFRAADGNNYGTEFANSINDRTHVINAIGSYYPVPALRLTVAALLQSGQPVNRVAAAYAIPGVFNPDGSPVLTSDLNGDGSSFSTAYQGNTDRYPGEGRNSDRLPWAETFDVGAQYSLRFGQKTSRLELTADVFNVLNTQNLSGYANNATQSNQIQVGAAGSGIIRRNASAPRQFQFGLRYAL